MTLARSLDARARVPVAIALLLLGVLVAAACQPVDPSAPPPPVTIFGNATPAVAAHADAKAVEVGVRFQASANGTVTGIRFYKGPGNTGTHVGSLWTSSGQKLASTTFTNESASGWQAATFSTPVAVTAGQTYVASYHAPAGNYAADVGWFSKSTTSGPLTAPSGANGVYRYGTSGFPTSSYNSTNYWVDVIYQQSATTSTTAAPTTTKAPTTTTTKAPTTTTTAPPQSGGFPNADTTGPRAGTTLRLHSGSLELDATYARNLPGSGTAADPYRLENIEVTGTLHVAVPHVLVRNCRVHGGQWYGLWAEANNVAVEDCEIGPTGSDKSVDVALSFENYGTARRVDVHNGRIGIKVRSNALIVDSFIHDIYQLPGDHTGGINTPQGNNGVIRHNTILGRTLPNGGRNHNGISIYTDRGESQNWLVENNYFDHNGYHLYSNVTPPYTIRNNVFTDNYERTPNLKWYFFNAQGGYTDSGNVNQNGTPIDL